MDKELRQLLSLLPDKDCRITNPAERGCETFFTGSLSAEKELIIMQCGIGKVNAAIGAVELIRRYSPEIIVSTGVAGGMSTEIPRLHVVASTEVAYHDVYCFSDCEYGQIQGLPARFTAEDHLVDIASGIENVHSGLIVSGDWFVDNKEKVGYIADRFPDALAVDMESGAIAQTCYIYNVPFISFRIISDTTSASAVTRGEQYFDFWERVADGSFAVLKEFLLRL